MGALIRFRLQHSLLTLIILSLKCHLVLRPQLFHQLGAFQKHLNPFSRIWKEPHRGKSFKFSLVPPRAYSPQRPSPREDIDVSDLLREVYWSVACDRENHISKVYHTCLCHSVGDLDLGVTGIITPARAR
jgi:hypothetical protein